MAPDSESQCPTMLMLWLQLCRVMTLLEGPEGLISFLSLLALLNHFRTSQHGQVAAGLQCWSLGVRHITTVWGTRMPNPAEGSTCRVCRQWGRGR